MIRFNLIIISIYLLLYNLIFVNLHSQINNIIVVKVGDSLITSVDVENEIITNLILNQQEMSQENINQNKNFAIKNLINKTIKKEEINKYEITGYNKKDLKDYIDNIATNLNTNQDGLREIFKNANINYQEFVDKHKIELLWNSLIFTLYRTQTNINIIEVENEVEKNKENKSEEELKKIKENILNKKKEEKLELFSRSHFSNLENSITIKFNE
jgi:hypothetical protein